MKVYIIVINLLMIFNFSSRTESIQRADSKEVDEVNEINGLLNGWHKAAATANFEAFFDCFDDEAYYIGTDENEKWTYREFKEFCRPYFDRGAAWDFKPYEREVFINKNLSFAWFDEKLDTWMGVCRASGVLIKNGDHWKIKHYQLSVTVPNDIVQDFIQLIDNYSKDKD